MLLLACENKPPPSPKPEASAPPPAVTSVATPTPILREAAAPIVVPVADAGPSSCKVVFGPTEQSFVGPATVLADGTIVGNEAGRARVWTPTSPKAPAVTLKWPACVVADKRVFCMSPNGTLTRTPLAGGEPKTIAKARPNTRIGAVAIAEHAVVAWLESHPTTEGEQLQAFGAMDDDAKVRISEDGAGATSIQLIEQGGRATAVYLDTRSAMVPVHARPLAVEGGKLVPKSDLVLHISGPPERGIDFALGAAAKKVMVLLPTAKETADFGVAVYPLADPLVPDVAPVWSMYPNGLDPAPIAATREGKTVYVVRVRPLAQAPGSPRVVELGSLDDAGVFTSLGTIGDGKTVTDVAIAAGSNGLWIVYGDATGAWLERRSCP